jgi:hypothetical protein
MNQLSLRAGTAADDLDSEIFFINTFLIRASSPDNNNAIKTQHDATRIGWPIMEIADRSSIICQGVEWEMQNFEGLRNITQHLAT